MATPKAYGEITIIDMTDSRTLSAYITSNQPNVVIYDPNSTVEYSPDWSKNNLQLTPVLFLDNDALSLTDPSVSIEWKRQAGSGSGSDLITGESVKNGILTVSNNMLKNITSGLLTYICVVTYIDPDTQAPVTTQVQMSFSLVKNATELKDVQITGDQTFKYNGEGTLVSASSIILTANLTNTSIKEWQYKNSDGNWVKYPGATASITLTVKATDPVFVNDLAIIKCVTEDSSMFDLHQIVKLHDGAAGSDTYTCILSNDTQSVPCSSNGTLYSTSLNGCDTKITIYKGGTDDTERWGIVATPSAGVTGSYDETTHVYTVTNITTDSGYVEFVCTKSSTATITKRFSINKDRSGSDGKDVVNHNVKSDVAVLKLNSSNVFVPTRPTFSATQTIGDGVPTSYAGRFKIYETTDGTTYTLKYTSGSNENSKAYQPSSTNVKAIKCELYKAGATEILLDNQTLAIVVDGKDGEQGSAGIDAVNVILGNSAEVIPCNTDGTVKENKDISIPYSCYKGTKRIAGTAVCGTLPSGMTIKSNKDATESTDGLIVISVAKGSTISSSISGDITITITAERLTSTHKFTWTKSLQAANGKSAVLFQIYAPEGDVIVNNTNNVTLRTIVTNGTTTVTSGVTYQWSKYINGNYADINGSTNDYLVVTPAMVDSFESFRCKATYNGQVYYAYWCVTDKSDPVQLQIFSSIGDQIINGVGIGGVFVRVYQNGHEVDEIKTTVFIEGTPETAVEGDFYYKLNKTAKTATLMKYTNSKWVEATGNDLPQGVYEWYRKDKDGNPIDTTKPFATGKVVYFDKTLIDKKVIFGCYFNMPTEEDTNTYILVDEQNRPIVDEDSNSITTTVYK